jgi:class 3 adenylate cyclase/tetratricopeptide (TPR) repeat protein
MRCASCGAEQPAGKRFCADCGGALAASCPGCGAAVNPGQRFCADCGAPLADPPGTGPPAAGTAPTARTPPAAPGTRAAAGPAAAAPGSAPAFAERRICSVLFADQVGFTPLSESRDPEEVRELLSRYFEAARTVIDRYGGSVEKFIGDAVMAVWGAPVAAEGDAERAVRAALDVVDAVAELGRQAGLAGLAARAGVVTGEVAVTVGAVGQGMVAGDTVNTAARVQAAAAPGGVLVDEATWRLTRASVAFTTAGEHELKGKAEPVPLWRAERVLAGRGGAQRVDGLEAALVGRDAELRLIKELFHATVDRRTPRLVSVTGPAGVGKSRLGWELEKYIDGLASTVYWHRGRCLAYGEGVAFWALAEMARQRFGIAEEDPPPVAAGKLDDGLLQYVADDPTARAYIRPRLARLLGVDDPGAATLSREELFAGWRLFFERLAATQPVVLLVEDLQRADPGLLDFLDHLLDWAREVPIYVLTLARPELAEIRPGWGAGRRNGTVLTLEPLDEAAMAAMLEGLVPGMPPAAKAVLAAQAQGIPLFAVETIRMLVDRDVVQPIDGVYRLVGDVGELAVPDTLQSLLAARLDALDPDARRLVADAAVLGGSFPAEALVAVSGLAEAQVGRLLTELVRREVLAVRADPLSPQRGQYAFVQTMLRQVAYDTLSRRERKARHLAVADHLARALPDSGEEVAEVIAQHLLDALAAAPDDPDVPELRTRAVTALTRAGERADRTAAPATALRLYAAAAGLADELDDAVETAGARPRAAVLRERAAAAALRNGDNAKSQEQYLRAAAGYQALGDPRAAARAAVGAGEAAYRRGEFTEARRLLTDALGWLSVNPGEDTVAALRALAELEAFSGGGMAAAEQPLQRAFDLAQALGLPEATLASLFTVWGIALVLGSRRAQGVAVLREAVRQAEAVGDGALAGRAQLNLAEVLVGVDPAASAEAARASLQNVTRVGIRQYLPVAVGNLMMALLLTGDWASVAEAAGTEDPQNSVTAEFGFAWVLLLHAMRAEAEPLAAAVSWSNHYTESADPQVQAARATCGDAPGALTRAWEGVRRSAAVGLAANLIWSWTVGAEAALDSGNAAEAGRLVDWLADNPVWRVPILRAERDRVRGRLLCEHGDRQAVVVLGEAVAAHRQAGSPFHLALALIDHAQALHAAGDPAAAEPLLREAAEIAERLGAAPLRRRAARVRPGAPAARGEVPAVPAPAGG